MQKVKISRNIFETKEVLIRKPERVVCGAEGQEEVRITIDTDTDGKIIKLALVYCFGRQVSDDWTEECHNRIYGYLTGKKWRIGTVAMVSKSGLSPKEVLTEGRAFRKAYADAYRENPAMDVFLERLESEFEKNKNEYEATYADVVDLASMKAALMGIGPDDKGLGFVDVESV